MRIWVRNIQPLQRAVNLRSQFTILLTQKFILVSRVHLLLMRGGSFAEGIITMRFLLVYLTPFIFCILFAVAGTDPWVRCLYVAGVMGM